MVCVFYPSSYLTNDLYYIYVVSTTSSWRYKNGDGGDGGERWTLSLPSGSLMGLIRYAYLVIPNYTLFLIYLECQRLHCVRIDIQIDNFFATHQRIWRATWLSMAARQSSRRTLLSVSTILDIKRLLLQICMCIHGPRGPRQKNSGLLSSAQLFTLDKKRYASIKRHEPLFLSQIRTEITEGNKITYPILEHNLNVLLVGSSRTMNRPSMTRL